MLINDVRTFDLPGQGTRILLNAGCGSAPRKRLPACFQAEQWREIRVDIDPAVAPDVVGSITNLSFLGNGAADAVWSSHNLEHIHSWEVPRALGEFKRVLKDDGFALITVPDLRAVARHLADDLLHETLYVSDAGPISALDVLFGHQASQEKGNTHMAHRTGFTSRSLGAALAQAGFAEVRVHEGTRWDLWAVATMPRTPDSVFDDLAGVML